MDRKDIKFKRRKSWNEFGHSHFLTFSTHHRKPYLLDERICERLADRIDKASSDLEFAVLAYVFMPDHVHLLVHPLNEIYDMSVYLKAIKQGPSRVAKNRGWIETDLWERGGGYDRNITNGTTRTEVINYIHQNPVRKSLEEESYAYRWSSANWFYFGERSDIACLHIEEVWG